ncbi:hypothetical protein [Planctomicrobium sp. SH664]|uniref:hypothetical protein n=1 Tax=Planctomicrobium sp. SH664 TaxID=3448125 RepID=UPI003F5C80DD
MKPNISEFSYGFAITHELLHCLPGIVAAPVFPSLYQEGQAGFGYDVMIQAGGIPLFIQFKLSDYMKRSTAAESRAGLLTCPFYRMHLRPKRLSQQHSELLKRDQAGDLVFYAAPLFHEPVEFNEAYRTETTVDRSVWIPPTAIGDLPDDDDHHVAFRNAGPAYLCSTPVLIQQPITAAAMVKRVMSALPDRQIAAQQTLERIKTLLEEILEGDAKSQRGLIPEDEESQVYWRRRNLHPLDRLALYSRQVLDTQLYLVRRREA